MTDYDLCELICETSEEFELYCKDKHCRKESCTILKHFPDADCSIAYVAYKLNLINEIEEIHNLVNGYCNLFTCGQCNVRKYKNEHSDLEDANCFIISAIIHMYKRFDLL